MKKTKDIACVTCNKLMTVGLFASKKQRCPDCSVNAINAPDPERDDSVPVRVKAVKDARVARQSALEVIAESDIGTSYASKVRRLMAALGFQSCPGTSNAVEYAKDYGDRNTQRFRLRAIFSRGPSGLEQGRFEAFCLTQQIYVPASVENIRDLGALICSEDMYTIFNTLGAELESEVDNPLETRTCDSCGQETGEFFKLTGDNLCRKCFTASAASVPQPAIMGPMRA